MDDALQSTGAGIAEKGQRIGCRTTSGLLIAAWVLWGVICAWLLSWRSYEPLFGRWSRRLFALVVTAIALFLLQTGVLLSHFRATANGRRSWVQRKLRLLRRRRHRRLLASMACGVPAGWVFLVVFWRLCGPESAGFLSNASLLLVSGLFTADCLGLLLLAERPTRIQRRRIFKLLAISAASAISLLLAEMLAAQMNLAPPDEWDINRPGNRREFRTIEFDTLISINHQGLREDKPVEPKPRDAYRVMVVGDSIIFGHGVNADEAIPQATERLLIDSGLANIEVVNVSRQGASPADYLWFLSQCGEFLQPDLIVIGFYVGNDCPIQQPFAIRTPDQLERILQNTRARAASAWWEDWTLGRFLGRRVSGIMNSPNMAAVPAEEDISALWSRHVKAAADPERRRKLLQMESRGWISLARRRAINPELVRAAIERPTAVADMMFLRDETRPAMEREWELCEAVLDDIVARAAQLEAELWFLCLPQAYQMSPEALGVLDSLGCLVLPEMRGHRELNDRLLNYCRRRSVPCLDPWDAFHEAQQAGRTVFFPIDTHYTPAGNRIVAELLADSIQARLKFRPKNESRPQRRAAARSTPH